MKSIRPTEHSGVTIGRALGAPVLLATVLSVAVPFGLTACADGSTGEEATSTSTITVSAAASLTDVFTELADGLMAEDPSVEVQLNYGSSAELVAQIEQGAPADVAAFADEETMAGLQEASLVEAPQLFATNRLAIVTPPGNPGEVTSLEDLASLAADGGIIALCAQDAPCGRFAGEVLQRAGVTLGVDRVTRATNARSTLTAVSTGDADVAIVYVTDATSAGDAVEVVDIPDAQNVVARYPIAVLSSTGAAEAAQSFVDRVLGEPGRDALERRGFGLP